MPKLRSIDNVAPRDFHPINRVCVGIGRQMADFVECRKAGDYFAKNGVLAVLGGDRLETDVELAAVRHVIGIDLVGKPAHRNGPAKMFLTNLRR